MTGGIAFLLFYKYISTDHGNFRQPSPVETVNADFDPSHFRLKLTICCRKNRFSQTNSRLRSELLNYG